MMKINDDLTVSLELLEEVQHKIGVRFNNPAFLIQALLHGSFIFLDQGCPREKSFVNSIFDTRGALGKVSSSNPKGTLKELCEKKHCDWKYEIINKEGPDHKIKFTVALYINGEQVSIGYGSRIIDAEQDAAEKYLPSLDALYVSL